MYYRLYYHQFIYNYLLATLISLLLITLAIVFIWSIFAAAKSSDRIDKQLDIICKQAKESYSLQHLCDLGNEVDALWKTNWFKSNIKGFMEASLIIKTKIKTLGYCRQTLPNHYNGELNTRRIAAYRKLARDWTVDESTVRQLFNAGADWYRQELSGEEHVKQ